MKTLFLAWMVSGNRSALSTGSLDQFNESLIALTSGIIQGTVEYGSRAEGSWARDKICDKICNNGLDDSYSSKNNEKVHISTLSTILELKINPKMRKRWRYELTGKFDADIRAMICCRMMYCFTNSNIDCLKKNMWIFNYLDKDRRRATGDVQRYHHCYV